MYNDYGNLFFEKWLRAMHTKLVLDFDDDIAAAKHEGKRQLSFFSYVMQEQNNKFTASMRFFNGFIYGTDYLKNHFAQYTFHAKHHFVLPTCVPHFNSILKKYTLNNACKIGWVGSSYNLKNIESVFPALEDLYQKTYFEFILICDENTSHSTSFPLYFIPWSKDREIENLLQIDLGLMPLIRTEASSGKAAFKLLQYMSLGIVPVASAVTVNREIVSDGFNGFLVEDESEWTEVLLKVLQRRNEFSQLGSAAYNSITNKYTFQSNEKTYLNFIHKLVSL
jgi:glycosyltransferase involved in cell wall biosynthesis